MLLIPCPNCGDREESEFDYGGRSVRQPDLHSNVDAWHETVYLRQVPAGFVEEFWYHSAGCECWILVSRNPVTHETAGRGDR